MTEQQYDIAELIDLDKLQKLMDLYSQSTAIPVGLVDHTGRFLIKSHWQDLCTLFHHCHPDALEQCEQNEIRILNHIASGEYLTFRCQNGLREIALPVMVEGRRVATMFLGQFLYDDDFLDKNQFVAQAHRFGFDEQEYLSALSQIPVYSHDNIRHIIDFYHSLVDMTADMGMKTIRLRESEAAFRAREEEYRQLVESANTIILRADTSGRITFLNEYGYAFFGFTPGTLSGEPLMGTIIPTTGSEGEDLQGLVRNILTAPDRHPTSEHEGITRDGRRVWVYWTHQPVYDQEHTLTEILFAGTDVTRRHHIHETLKKSESRLIAAQRLARMGTYEFVLPDGEAVWSPEIYEFLKMDPSEKPLPMSQAFSFVHPDDRQNAAEVLEHAAKHQSQLDVSFRFMPKGHDPVYIRTIGQVQAASPDGPLVFFGIMMDITESRLAEQRITRSLEEKEVLLREIHHRVKNNFQIVSSLLTLQAGNCTSEQRAVFDTAVNRIKSMALMHELLYRSSSLAGIPAEEYLARICKNVTRIIPHTDAISLTIDIAPLFISIEHAIYFGLIVNELVTNAYQHGFPDGNEGSITVTMKAENGQYCLTIIDTGGGFPEGFDWEQDSGLGLRLVRSLAERQLNGSIELTEPGQPSYRITFPIPVESQPSGEFPSPDNLEENP